jgi:hypothetical protein
MANKITIKSYKRNQNARANSHKAMKSRIPTHNVFHIMKNKNTRPGKKKENTVHIS